MQYEEIKGVLYQESHICSTKRGHALPEESHPQYAERVYSTRRGCEVLVCCVTKSYLQYYGRVCNTIESHPQYLGRVAVPEVV